MHQVHETSLAMHNLSLFVKAKAKMVSHYMSPLAQLPPSSCIYYNYLTAASSIIPGLTVIPTVRWQHSCVTFLCTCGHTLQRKHKLVAKCRSYSP